MGLKIGDVSPLGAMVSGKGAIADVARTGMMGALPFLATKNRGEDKSAPAAEDQKKKQMRGRGMGRGMQAPGMKKGGKVKGTGCCKKGVRKCKMY